MKSFLLISTLFLTLNTQAATKTVFRVYKSIKAKNVLHYKVDIDASKCTFTSGVYAEWKMDEEDGRWKPLAESSGMIKKPLWPNNSTLKNQEINFDTEAIENFQEKGVVQSSNVGLFIEKQNNGRCLIKNLVLVDNKDINLSYLHVKTFLGSISKVTIKGEGFIDKKEFNKVVTL
jgi:hypothetical protein